MKRRLGNAICFLLMMQMTIVPFVFSYSGPGTEYFASVYCEALVFESNQLDKARLEIYLQVPYNEVNFVKQDREYIGRYEIAAALQDSMQQQVWQQGQSVELHAKDFSQTISSRLSNTKQFSVLLNSGTYSLQVQIIDQETKKTTTFKRSVTVNPFLDRPLALSDILLVHRINQEGAHTNIIPNLSGMVGQGGKKVYLYFEIYARVKLDSVALMLYALNEKNDTLLLQKKTMLLNGTTTQSIWELPDMLLPVSKTKLMLHAYSFQHDSGGSIMHAQTSKNLVVHLKNLPLTISDLDKAIEQLQYIAKEDEIDHIREASTSPEKEKRFLEFWQKHNPDPVSPTNSLMEEYYTRVAYADKHFSQFGVGWKSDMGMIFIIFGAPEEVERHPFNADEKPYEIWYYYNLGRQFIFIDHNGFGDYRLQYPTTDLWGRIY